MATWKQLDSQNALNTAVAATAAEDFPFADAKYSIFNGLLVVNAGSVDISVSLDQTEISGKTYSVPKNTTLAIDPSEGIMFRTLRQRNLDASTAEVANNIRFLASYSEKVGE